MTNELETEVSKQHRIWKAVLKEFEGACKEIQIEAYHMTNKWLLGNRIERNNNGVKLATDKQKALMDKLKIEYSDTITLKESSEMISKKLEA